MGIIWCIHHPLDYVCASRVTNELLEAGLPARRVTLDEYRTTLRTARGALDIRDVEATVFFLSSVASRRFSRMNRHCSFGHETLSICFVLLAIFHSAL